MRINKAVYDSAGSAISSRMSNQIRGMKQANRNAQQANNLIQTAENGLNNINDILSRMRELALQASTDTLNDTDRASINLEFQASKNEIGRIADSTKYNGISLLKGALILKWIFFLVKAIKFQMQPPASWKLPVFLSVPLHFRKPVRHRICHMFLMRLLSASQLRH